MATRKKKSGECIKCDPPKFFGSLESHMRKVHYLQARVTYSDGQALVPQRNPDTGEFHCLRCNESADDGQVIRFTNCRNIVRAALPSAGAKPLDLYQEAPVSVTPHGSQALLGAEDDYVPRALSVNSPPPSESRTPPPPPSHDDTDLNLEERRIANLAAHRRDPDEHTVVLHPEFNFTSFDIVVNTLYRVVICRSCGTAVDLGILETHIHAHSHV
ncbi:hypothetical protein B0H19DRAFT_1369094 [Mycena capillaripes]|nr:hypothetical protein B0H19DRAFT_1369094 [Mycena capillaripes]